MSKIPKVNKKTFTQIVKQRKLNIAKAAERKDASISVTTPVKSMDDASFDSFVRDTAREMLKDMPKYELQISKGESIPLESLSSDKSIWAPWSKLFGK